MSQTISYIKLADSNELEDKNWFNNVKKALKTKDKSNVILEILTNSDVIKHPQWLDTIKYLLTIQPTFEDIAEEVYGQRVSIYDDEGWLCQGWENSGYTDMEEILTLMLKPQIVELPEWKSLMELVIKKCKEISFGLSLKVEILIEENQLKGPKIQWLSKELKIQQYSPHK